ncbi:LCP family protein [Gordonia sp. HY002]|uniref:LCP family protein n=1 Tax=Gordonia zhenghanii TaxID=2911516 RepID=UPI001EF0C5BF|nr:LCP family protein [Gordonia zhenghanii]MCF8568901.1 LCP family protein [Gordonia zhenghanii]MCF8602996.1 LCP family protein [Gordonia zhenghanii]
MSSDRPGDDQSDAQPTPPRRSRRGGRSSDSFDFRDRFGDTGALPRVDGLREPSSREEYVRPRGRLTVRQLMEQMDAEAAASRGAAQRPEQQQPERRRRPSRPAPPTQTPPAHTPPTQSAPPPQRRAPRPPTRPAGPPVPSASEPEETRSIPPVAGYEWEPVDLSDEATAARAASESRGQTPPSSAPSSSDPSSSDPAEPTPETDSTPDTEKIPAVAAATTDAAGSDSDRPRRRPLEPTPDLTAAIKRIRPSQPTITKKARTRKTATTSGRVLVALACILSLVGTGYVWNLNRTLNGAWNVVAALNPDDANVRDKEGQHGDETYLIVGTDTRNGQNADVGAGEAGTVEGARADTILLVNVPADRSRVVAVSWPRDLAVDRPECEQWDFATKEYGSALPAANDVKINSVFGDGGPSCLVKTITQMSGLDINHFIAMDFAGFEHVVRAIGGVEVCSKVPLFDDQIGYIVKTAGRNIKLTPKQALNYVRARHIAVEGNGDYGRIKRQQLFLSSLLRSTLSSDVITNPNKLTKIVNTFIDYSYVDQVDTNALIDLAQSMQGMDAGAVTFLTIPTAGTSTDGQFNELPRTDAIDAIFNAIIDDEQLPGEKKKADEKKPEAPTTTKAPERNEMTAQYAANLMVRVLNGAGEQGLAETVMNELIRQGVEVSGIGDASVDIDQTVVRYGSGEKDSAATVASMFPGAKIQLDKTVKTGVQVILGADYGGIETVGALPDAGSTLTTGQLPENTSHGDLPNDLAITNAGDTTCS